MCSLVLSPHTVSRRDVSVLGWSVVTPAEWAPPDSSVFLRLGPLGLGHASQSEHGVPFEQTRKSVSEERVVTREGAADFASVLAFCLLAGVFWELTVTTYKSEVTSDKCPSLGETGVPPVRVCRQLN